jgi:hypothetical protein
MTYHPQLPSVQAQPGPVHFPLLALAPHFAGSQAHPPVALFTAEMRWPEETSDAMSFHVVVSVEEIYLARV